MAIGIVTKATLVDALTDFRERGDERWPKTSEITERVDTIVDERLAESGELSSADIADILGSI